ncbi:hypothetical protein BVI2075_330031 [Burkholderia vietnamiensis]|nr:hypothetical protein BVI2075_330031 [Burkholderia vietnamiensis]
MAAQADRIFAVAHARRSGRRALSPVSRHHARRAALRRTRARPRAEQRGREAANGPIRMPVDLSRHGARAAPVARARTAPGARDPVERQPRHARHRDQERRHGRPVRSRAVRRHRARVQAEPARICARHRRLRRAAARARVRVVERVGRRRRRLVRLHDVLAEPHRRARRRARRVARRHRQRHGRPARIPRHPGFVRQTGQPRAPRPGRMTRAALPPHPFTETATDRPRR